LQIRYPQERPITLVPEPLYSSYEKSFISTYYRPKIKEVFDKARVEKWKAEQLAEELGKKGTTLFNAKITFFVFGMVAAILLVGIILATTIPNLVQK